MVSFMMNETRNKKMNESSASPQDEIVTSIIDRIHAQVKDYYAAPLKLLECFEAIDDLLSGILTPTDILLECSFLLYFSLLSLVSFGSKAPYPCSRHTNSKFFSLPSTLSRP
jgi:hypothetical protein